MSEVVRENPCTECGIKGLYEHCEDKCVQYRKWYQYQKGRADAIDEFANALINDGKVSAMRVLKIKEQLKEQNECG